MEGRRDVYRGDQVGKGKTRCRFPYGSQLIVLLDSADAELPHGMQVWQWPSGKVRVIAAFASAGMAQDTCGAKRVESATSTLLAS